MRNFDLSPLMRQWIGFDKLANALQNAGESQSFPPYNIEKSDDNHYRITLALAGFRQEDLEIQLEGTRLSVKGTPEQPKEEKSMKIFNTLSRKKEEFVPLTPGEVKMYVCGPTVYNFIHIGNARPMIVFDTVRRYFEYKGYDVRYVSNFTDVDDKIIKKAIEEGVDADTVSRRYIEEC